MSHIQLCQSVETSLRLLQLESEDLLEVRSCVYEYAKEPGEGLDLLCWSVYRIWNALKSLLKVSDWQRSEAILKRRFMRMLSILPQQMIEGRAGAFAHSVLTRLYNMQRDRSNEMVNFIDELPLRELAATEVRDTLRTQLRRLLLFI